MQQVELAAAQRLLISYLNLLFSVKIVYNYRLIQKKSSSQILTLWLGDKIDNGIGLSTLSPSLGLTIWPQDSHSMGDSDVSFFGDIIRVHMCATDDVIPNNFMINTVFLSVENMLFCSILCLITTTWTLKAVLRIRIWDPGSGIRDPGSGAFLTPGSGIWDPE